MAKKTAEQLISDLKELFIEREVKYLEKLLNPVYKPDMSKEEIALQEELDAEEMKFLKNLKSRLKYIENLNNELTGKTGKERKIGNDELWATIIEMKSSVGEIVRSIPKTKTGS